jgi:hypothetical protein
MFLINYIWWVYFSLLIDLHGSSNNRHRFSNKVW